MITKISAAAVLAWLGFALACTPSQPLPFPSNPPSVVKACPDTPCGSNQVCNRAIGGGTCTAPCTTDSGCAGIAAGLVCHPAAVGGVCAPDCNSTVSGLTGNDLCHALEPSLSCVSGRCAAVAATGQAMVRFFLASAKASTVSIAVDQQPLDPSVAPLAAGVPSAYLPVAAGDHVFSFDFARGRTIDQSITLLSDKHYTVPVYDTNSSFDSQWFDDDTLFAPPGRAGLRYFQACPSIGTQDVLFDLGAGAQPVVGGVGVNGSPSVADVASGSGTLEIGDSPGGAPSMIGPAIFVAGQLYTAITWCGGEVSVPPTSVLLSPATAPAAFTQYKASAFRLLNASDLDTVILTFDARAVRGATTQGAMTLDPKTAYRLLAPGSHTVHLWRDFTAEGGVPQGTPAVAEQSFDFAAGSVYSIIVGGQGKIDPSTLKSEIFSETLSPNPASATQAVVRLLNFASADQTHSAQLSQTAAQVVAVGAPVLYLGDGGDQLFDVSIPTALSVTLGAAVLSTPSLSFTPRTRYTVIATGSASTVTLWVVGLQGQDFPLP